MGPKNIFFALTGFNLLLALIMYFYFNYVFYCLLCILLLNMYFYS